MEPIPLTWVMEGDYEVRLIMANVEDTLDELAAAVAALTVGICIPERVDGKLRIRIQGQKRAQGKSSWSRQKTRAPRWRLTPF